jgi:probable phosphoglycerate mutase
MVIVRYYFVTNFELPEPLFTGRLPDNCAMQELELVLVRHGETDWNRELRFQGQIDVPLNATGYTQARRVAERLASESVQQLYSSDLARTMQTAGPTADCLKLHSVADPALREQAFGLIDGMRVSDIQEQYPDIWARWRAFDPDYAPPGGESQRQFQARVRGGGLERLTQRHPGQTLLMVTHGGVLDMIYRAAHGLPLGGPRQCDIPNAGISRVRTDGHALEILSWADTAHLADLPPQPVYDQTRVATLPDAGPTSAA